MTPLVFLHDFYVMRPLRPCKRGHIVADTNVSPFARARNICCGHKFCVRDTKNVSDFVQKHFVSATMCPRLPGPLFLLSTIAQKANKVL